MKLKEVGIISKENHSSDQEELTPWQKEHLRYLKEHEKEQEKAAENSSEVDPISEAQSDSEKEVENKEEVTLTDTVEESQKPHVSFADRLPKLKKYRNKLLHKRLLILILIFAVPLVMVLYYVSPLSHLAAVNVSGNTHLSAEKVVQTAGLETGENLWQQFFNRKAAVQKLKKEVPRVKEAKIQFSSLNTFKLSLTEYQEVALLVDGKKYLPILEDGTIIRQSQSKADQGKIILENFSDQKKILATLKQYHQLSKALQSSVSQIEATPRADNDELLTLFMNDGNQVIVNISKLAEQLSYYPQVAKEMDEKGIVDMEVGIFAHPYEKKTAQSEETEESSE